MSHIEKIKELRNATGISLMECRKALEKAAGDIEKAKKILREEGKKMIRDKATKSACEGIISAYIHPGAKLGVMLDLKCETDFAAKSEAFKELAHELCLQIAAAKPLFIDEESIPEEKLREEKEIYEKQLRKSGKPEDVIRKAVEGRIKKYKEEVCLLLQTWIKDASKTVKDLIEDYAAKIGEKIEVARFVRYEI